MNTKGELMAGLVSLHLDETANYTQSYIISSVNRTGWLGVKH